MAGTSRWRWLIGQLWGRMWFRSTLFSLGAVAAALGAVALGPFVPSGSSRQIGADAVGDILGILASSMLTVATFSLSTLVAAYAAATNTATPRATTLLMEDSTAQNALGTFIGAFLFSLVGIIALNTGLYGEEGRVVLFLATLVVVAIVVITLLRWIDRLPRMGRMGETMSRVEAAAVEALRERAWSPHPRRHRGPARTAARAGTPSARGAPATSSTSTSRPWRAPPPASAACSSARCRAGTSTATPSSAGPAPRRRPEAEEAIRDAILLGDDRSFRQDPRFGLIVLGEIASRALSDAVNDAGTAIRVLAGGLQAFDAWCNPGKPPGDLPRYPSLAIPALDPADLVADLYRPIARDGAANPAVMERLLKSLAALPEIGGERLRAPAEAEARRALALAQAAIAPPEERAALRALAPPWG